MVLGTDWLKDAVFYQVYPTGFFDANGDGVGDLRGIIEKLDYIKSLGVDGIWVNPFYLSEFRDGGYDIVDYYKVDPRFGDEADLSALFSAAESAGLKVILDLVVGHTSDKCAWFLESKKAAKNKYSEYYIWSENVFDDSAGLRMINGVSERDGNYAVNFFAMQPALNFGFAEIRRPWQRLWTDPVFDKIHAEVIGIMKYYLEKGAAGFRIDMASSLIKYDDGTLNAKLWTKLLGAVRREYPRAVFISEWAQPEIAVGEAGFDLDFLIHIRGEAYNSLFRAEAENRAYGLGDAPSYFRRNSVSGLDIFFDGFLGALNGLNDKGYISVPSGNHDLKRIGTDRTQDELKTIFAFLMTIPSVPFIYNGDEIGMKHIAGLSKDGGFNRTGSRTPMQFTAGENAGFSQAPAEKLYLPVDISASHNVAAQEKDENSLLTCVKALIKTKKAHGALSADAGIRILSGYYDVPFLYERTDGKERIIIAINAKGGKADCAFPYKGALLDGLNESLDENHLNFNGFGYAIFRLGQDDESV
ncbi:MAG: glycosylase [Clostridiales bacterium]|jgi:maltose alpha-D-glucosyltransferase/alpha-amylase|nr:glycosylase [Clostridiales bacterium]